MNVPIEENIPIEENDIPEEKPAMDVKRIPEYYEATDAFTVFEILSSYDSELSKSSELTDLDIS